MTEDFEEPLAEVEAAASAGEAMNVDEDALAALAPFKAEMATGKARAKAKAPPAVTAEQRVLAQPPPDEDDFEEVVTDRYG